MILIGRKKRLSEMFGVSLRDALVTVGMLLCASVFCYFVSFSTDGDRHAPLIFVLAVLLVSRMTSGYTCGIFASVAAVFGVNYVFTFPYLELNFAMPGYMLTFASMLAVSIIVSALTTQIKRQDRIRMETEKEKVRANLLRAISHDIRTPLTSITGAACAVLENGDSLSEEKKRELVSDINDEATSLIRLVENLLSVTRINDETACIEKRDEAVEEVVAEAVGRFKKHFPNIGISVRIPDEILFVPMDAVLIEQVLINLFENAAIHGKTTSMINVTVTENALGATFTVCDNGVGINGKSITESLSSYVRFESGESADSKRNMGIGLSVCVSIIKAHGGEMTAGDAKNGGAEFSFTLPMTNNIRTGGIK